MHSGRAAWNLSFEKLAQDVSRNRALRKAEERSCCSHASHRVISFVKHSRRITITMPRVGQGLEMESLEGLEECSCLFKGSGAAMQNAKELTTSTPWPGPGEQLR